MLCLWAAMACDAGASVQAECEEASTCDDAQGQDTPCTADADCPGLRICHVRDASVADAVGFCDDPYMVDVGGRCRWMLDVSCREGLLCYPRLPSEPDGACRPPHAGAQGDLCPDAFGCGEGLACTGGTPEAPTCAATSIAWRADGEGCGEPEQRCRFGLSCNREMSPPTCIAEHSAAAGDPCSSNRDCSEGLECNGGFWRCSAPATLEEGEPCLSDTGGPAGWMCRPGLSCNWGLSPPTCVRPGTGAPESPCGSDEHCAEGLSCVAGACSASR